MSKGPIFIPTFISTVEYKPARVSPRIFFYNGLKLCDPYFIEGYGSTSSTVVSSSQSSFPYFDHYKGNITDQSSLSLLFNNEEAPYGEIPSGSLYTDYWETYVELLYNPKTRLTLCSAVIPVDEYYKLELNDIVTVKGNHYHLRAINDYNLETGECTLQLLGPIIPDALFRPAPVPKQLLTDYNSVQLTDYNGVDLREY
jgi:hypothetical protein